MTRFCLLSLVLPILPAQTMVERAILTGHGAAAASKAGSTTANTLTKALNGAKGAPGNAAPPVTAARRPAAGKAKAFLLVPDVVRAEVKDELPDVSLLKLGMLRADVEKVAGKPSQMLSMPEHGKLIEKYKYMADGKELRLVLEDGKLIEIKP